jgi:3-hydroxybutyryl-CoA dehydrogenase
MNVTVISDEALKNELKFQRVEDDPSITWIDDLSSLNPTDVCIDLLFENDPARVKKLTQSVNSLIIVNYVTGSLKELPENFARINGWRTLLKKEIIECSSRHDHHHAQLENIFSLFEKKTEFVPDIKGFVTARVISMIVNEAYFTLEENVSTKDDIDLAMKLGTNYPYGPFEWSQRIGLKNISALLESLSEENSRYTPSVLLKKESSLS